MWLKPTGPEHKYRATRSLKTREWLLTILALTLVTTCGWTVALGMWEAQHISCLPLPYIPLNDLKEFLSIVVSSVWANISLNKMIKVIHVIVLEAVGWGIRFPAGSWLWSSSMLPLEPPFCLRNPEASLGPVFFATS